MDVHRTGRTILRKWTEDFDGKLGHEWQIDIPERDRHVHTYARTLRE